MLVVTCLAGLLVLVLIQSDKTDSEAAQSPPNADVQPERERSIASNLIQQETIIESPSNSNEKPDLLTGCPDPAVEVLSEACLDALNQHFLSKTFGFKTFYYRSANEGEREYFLRYQRIFADPVKDRGRVFATLDQEECFLRGDDYRAYWVNSGLDPKEYCNAEAFTNYAQFGAICYGFREGRDAEREWVAPQQTAYGDKTRFQHFASVLEEFRKSGDNAVAHERRKAWLWEEVLEVRWLKRQCANFESVPTLDGDRYVKEYELLKNFSIQRNYVDERTWESRDPRVNVYESLRRLAAVFGDGLTTRGYRQDWEAWQELVYGVHFGDSLDMEALDKGRLNPTIAREVRLFTALDASISLDNLNVAYDWHWLVESVCRTSDYRGSDEDGNKSCRWCVADFRRGMAESLVESRDSVGVPLEESIPSPYRDFHRAIDRFEEVALELGIYD